MNNSNEQLAVAYCRVSTADQKLEVQEEEVKKFCKIRDYKLLQIYTDKLSGRTIERDGFQKMMSDIRKNGATIIVVTKLDRVGRNLRDLLNIMNDLDQNHINLIAIGDSIDTTTPIGKLAIQIMGALNEYERELIIERTRIGREYAKQRKVKFGRHRVKVDMTLARRLLLEGVPKRQVCRSLRIAPGTLYNRLKESE